LPRPRSLTFRRPTKPRPARKKLQQSLRLPRQRRTFRQLRRQGVTPQPLRRPHPKRPRVPRPRPKRRVLQRAVSPTPRQNKRPCHRRIKRKPRPRLGPRRGASVTQHRNQRRPIDLPAAATLLRAPSGSKTRHSVSGRAIGRQRRATHPTMRTTPGGYWARFDLDPWWVWVYRIC